MTLRRFLLPVVGAGLIGIGLIGGFTGAWGSSWPDNPGWFGHMSGRGHMSWFIGGSGAGETVPAVTGAPEIHVTGSEFGFSPEVITLTGGETVNLVLTNEGGIVHDLTIPELGVRLVAQPGQRAVTAITPGEAGVFEVLCTLPGHAAQGMVATLVVEESQ